MCPEFLFADLLTKPILVWLTFPSVVVLLLAFDLGVLHRKHREVGEGESLLLSAGCLSLGVGFGG